MTRAHLSEESILLLHSGELEAAEQAAAEAHLEVCPHCRTRYHALTAELESAAAEVMRWDQEEFRSKLAGRRVERRLPARTWIAASSVAASVVLALLFFTWAARPVTASQIIEGAISEQSGRTARPRFVAVRSGRLDCTPEFGNIARNTNSSAACVNLRSALEQVRWDVRSPLSAASFRDWRNSLSRKEDVVRQSPGGLVLKTTTTDSPLRTASLEVRAGTFHPVALRLEIAGMDAVDIEESVAPPAVASVVEPPSTKAADVPVTRGAVDVGSTAASTADSSVLLDIAEAEAYLRLHRVSADSGFETIVSRRREDVEVFGLVRDEHRASEIRKALESVSGITLNLKIYSAFEPGDDRRFPAAEIGNSLPPLAREWLKQNFPQAAERQAFVDAIISKARVLRGLAATAEQLNTRIPLLSKSARSPELEQVQANISARLERISSELRTGIEPFAGPCARVQGSDSIGVEQARTIDSALTRLLVAAKDDTNDRQAEAARLSKSFGCAAN